MPPSFLRDGLSGKVFLTGGAGFLGRAIIRTAQEYDWPAQFTVFSRDETIQDEARKRYPAHYILGDVRDRDRLTYAMAGHDLVIHAAAAKYVPEGEYNPTEFVDINVNGSLAVAKAAIAAGIPRVVAVSTDKAVKPVNTYGMTKALMERMMAEANAWGKTVFTIVRYGNVVGSTGSVIPLFAEQARTGTVRLTSPEMTRFWLSVHEAIGLIVDATNIYGARMIVPKARAMKMQLLAELMAGSSADIQVIGTRPGEKMHEELLHEEESLRAVDEPERFTVLAISEGSTRSRKPVSYTSQSPIGWITATEMAEMIEAAAEI